MNNNRPVNVERGKQGFQETVRDESDLGLTVASAWTDDEYVDAQDWARSVGVDFDCGLWANPDSVGIAWSESRDPEIAGLNYSIHNNLKDAVALVERVTGTKR